MPAHQDTQGLLSPWLRDRRLRRVGRRVARGSVVLDLACGTGALRHALPEGCSYFGVDRIPMQTAHWGDDRPPVPARFLQLDVSDPASPAAVQRWIGARADVITMVAFLEHLPDPARLVARYLPLLREGGRIIGTTPHPRGRRLHDALASIGICSRDGADEHETFLGRPELESVASSCGLSLGRYEVFLGGLNQHFEFTQQVLTP